MQVSKNKTQMPVFQIWFSVLEDVGSYQLRIFPPIKKKKGIVLAVKNQR